MVRTFRRHAGWRQPAVGCPSSRHDAGLPRSGRQLVGPGPRRPLPASRRTRLRERLVAGNCGGADHCRDISSRSRSRPPRGPRSRWPSTGSSSRPRLRPVTAGMLIGSVYRLRVTGIPLHEGQELFPTIEVIDRTYTPIHYVWRFPIPIELTQQDLELRLDGPLRDTSDLPGRSAAADPYLRCRLRSSGSMLRRATTRCKWPMAWAVPWPSCESADGCRSIRSSPMRRSCTARRRI